MASKKTRKSSDKLKTAATSGAGFDGFIAPDGGLIAIDDADAMFAFLVSRTENQEEILDALKSMACQCAAEGRVAAAHAYLAKILELVDKPEDKAGCLLGMGQMLERSGDPEGALEVYSRAFELPPGRDVVWYFLNNNLGYCLNLMGRHQEAEVHCRAAIEIEPARFNAYKNLGIALAGQGRHAEAARNLMTAARACPGDGRALAHLDVLLAEHPEILKQEPDLALELADLYGHLPKN